MPEDLSALAPKYHRIAAELRRQIENGTYAPGDKLPSETALAERYRVSVSTLRQAINVLRAVGLIESRHGAGTFVHAARRLRRRSRRSYKRGPRPAPPRLEQSAPLINRGPLPPQLAALLGAPSGPDFVIRKSVLTEPETGRVDEIIASYLPANIALGTLLERPVIPSKALFLCVEELTGKRYAYANDLWLARLPFSEEATILRRPSGSPVMHFIHVAYAKDRTLLEISESVWPANQIMFVDNYDIVPDA